MMKSDLVGQYVVDGYGDLLYHVIVAVYMDRGVLRVMAKNIENRLVSYEADGCVIVRFTPHQKDADEMLTQWLGADEEAKPGLMDMYQDLLKVCKATTSE